MVPTGLNEFMATRLEPLRLAPEPAYLARPYFFTLKVHLFLPLLLP